MILAVSMILIMASFNTKLNDKSTRPLSKGCNSFIKYNTNCYGSFKRACETDLKKKTAKLKQNGI